MRIDTQVIDIKSPYQEFVVGRGKILGVKQNRENDFYIIYTVPDIIEQTQEDIQDFGVIDKPDTDSRFVMRIYIRNSGETMNIGSADYTRGPGAKTSIPYLDSIINWNVTSADQFKHVYGIIGN